MHSQFKIFEVFLQNLHNEILNCSSGTYLRMKSNQFTGKEQGRIDKGIEWFTSVLEIIIIQTVIGITLGF